MHLSPQPGEEETSVSLGLVTSQPTLTSELQVPVGDCILKDKMDIQLHMHTHGNIYTLI